VDALFLPVNIYLLQINSALFCHFVMIIVRRVKKTMMMFLVGIIHAGGTLVLASPSLRWRMELDIPFM
jgi:hypothetical protein